MPMTMEQPYLLDKTLPLKVKKYMDENKYVNVEEMTEYLMKNHREYQRKPKKSFLKSVKKVYNWQLYINKERKEGPIDIDIAEANSEEELPVKKQRSDFSIDSIYKSSARTGEDKESNVIDKRLDLHSSTKSKRKRDMSELMDFQIESSLKKKRKKFASSIPTTSLEPMHGVESLYKIGGLLLTNFVDTIFKKDAPKSVLLSGPEGSGKTMFATSLARVSKSSLLRVPVPDLFGSPHAAAEKESVAIEAVREALAIAPCILLLENLDSLSSKDGGLSKGPEKKVCDQLEAALTELKEAESSKGVIVVAESRNPPGLDPSLRARFEVEAFMPVLGKLARKAVLKVLCPDVAPDFDFEEIALRTSSYVGGDLKMLVKKAKHHAMNRKVVDSLKEDSFVNPETFFTDYCDAAKGKSPDIVIKDFLESLSAITPTLKRQGFPSVPNTKWEDVGGLEDIKAELREKILDQMQYPDLHERYGANKPNGILLWGPPGCGKTLLAKAVANHAGVNLYAVMGPELLSMYQGESERAIREVFNRAASVAPCVIFFDEFDCICPRRNAGATEGGSKMNIVNTLLVEMNGFNQRKDVYVMAATNRPDMVDPAVLRPERFDTSLYVGLPDLSGRIAILNARTKNGTNPKLAPDVDLEEIGAWCENFSGADCAQLVYMASKSAITEVLEGKGGPKEEGQVGILFKRHFLSAIKRVAMSVGPEEQKKYLRMKSKFELSKKSGKQVILDDEANLTESDFNKGSTSK